MFKKMPFVILMMAPFFILPWLLAQAFGRLGTTAISVTHTPTSYILPSPTGTQEQPACVVTAESLNVRSSPGVNNSVVLKWLYKDDFVTILNDAPQDEWIHIQFGDLVGWINSNYCKRINQQ